MKYKYISSRPFWVGEKKYVQGDMSDEKYSDKFIKVTSKNKTKEDN